jgi:hypothetical protein
LAEPDFLKNKNQTFYFKNSDDAFNYWINKFGDRIVENKKTGRCKLTVFLKKKTEVVENIKHFDKALDIISAIKYNNKDREDE